MEALFPMTAAGAVVWSLWVRRTTWSCRWETATTAAVAFLGAALVLAAPGSSAIVPHGLWYPTGHQEFTDLAGDICAIASGACLVYALLTRFAYGSSLRKKFGRCVLTPTALVAVPLIILFTVGDAGVTMHERIDSVAERAYTALLSAMLIYLLGYAVRALLVLRRHQKHRTVANVYLVACAGGLVSCVLTISGAVSPDLDSALHDAPAMALSTLIFAAGLAFGAAYSWRRKTAQFTTLQQAIRTD